MELKAIIPKNLEILATTENVSICLDMKSKTKWYRMEIIKIVVMGIFCLLWPQTRQPHLQQPALFGNHKRDLKLLPDIFKGKVSLVGGGLRKWVRGARFSSQTVRIIVASHDHTRPRFNFHQVFISVNDHSYSVITHLPLNTETEKGS